MNMTQLARAIRRALIERAQRWAAVRVHEVVRDALRVRDESMQDARSVSEGEGRVGSLA